MTSSIRHTFILLFSMLFSSASLGMSVTFLNPGKQGERFWDMVTETMQAAAEDFQIDLEVIYAERNRVRMTQLGVAVTQRDSPPDYLILVNEEQAAEQILLAASRKQIRTLMLLNDFLPQQHARVGQPGDNPYLLGAIIPDNFSAGKRMMTALLQCVQQRHLQPPSHVLAIGGDQLSPASIDRNNGALAVLEANTDKVTLDRFLYANWNQQEAESLTLRYLKWAKRNQVKPAAIWSANDPIAFGAHTALTASGYTPGKDICMVGLNWSAQGLERVKSGELLLTDGGHFLAGAWAMVLLHDYHARLQQGQDKPIGHVQFQMQSIDSNNVERYLDSLGDENWGKIDFTRFLQDDKPDSNTYDFSLNHVLNTIAR